MNAQSHLHRHKLSTRCCGKWQRIRPMVILAAGVCLLILLTVAPAGADSPSFFGTGSDTTLSIAVGDIDGDGDLDLVTGNYEEQNTVFMNDGAGHFYVGPEDCNAPNVRCFGPGSDLTQGVALGDVDGDGDLDIVTANFDDDDLVGYQNVIYLNDGAGNFDASRDFGTGSDWTTSIALGDMDGDGDLDIVAGNYFEPNEVYFNDGSGTFDSSAGFGTGVDMTRALALGDMDGDGDLDIVTGNLGEPNAVYINNGGGSFAGSVFGWGVDPTRSLVVGDVDHDGFLDIAVGNYVIQNAVFINDGAGNFYFGPLDCNPSNVRCFGSGLDWTWSVTIGDLDGKGDLDIAAGNRQQQNEAYLNDGYGYFTTALPFGSGADMTFAVTLGDVDNNGAPDLIAGNVLEQNVAYLNDGGGSFQPGTPVSPPTSAWSVTVGDLERDRDLDLVVGVMNGPNLVYLNGGDGDFFNPQTFGTDLDFTWEVAVGDLDGDGALDLVVGNYDHYTDLGEQNTVYLNDGAGEFATGYNLGPSTSKTTCVATGDLDGDRDLDIVVGNVGQSNAIHLNDGLGNFSPGIDLGPGSDATYSVALGDLDGDGHLDIVVGNNGQQNVIYWNDGRGNFASGQPFGVGWDATYAVAVADLDGNGALDIIVGNNGQQNLVYLNDGTGQFYQGSLDCTASNVRCFGSGSDSTYSINIGDMDGDGDLDIAQGNVELQNRVYVNEGAGDFDWSTPSRRFGPVDDWTRDIALGDMNGDGTLDIVVGNFTGADLSAVYLNAARMPDGLVNQPPYLILTRPDDTADANLYASPELLDSLTIPVTYTLYDPEGQSVRFVRAFYSPDGGGRWLPAAATSDTITSALSTSLCTTSLWLDEGFENSFPPGDWTIYDIDGLGTSWEQSALYAKSGTFSARHAYYAPVYQQGWLVSPQITLRGSDNVLRLYDRTSFTSYYEYHGVMLSTGSCDPLNGQFVELVQLSDVSTAWQRRAIDLSAYDGQDVCLAFLYQGLDADDWYIDDVTVSARGCTPEGTHTYTWDTFASGFFGQSDNVVFRLEAYAGLHPYTHTIPGPYHWPYAAASTFPFRVRGTQVRVLSGTIPVANALVYRLPAGQSFGTAIADNAGRPFRTDDHGYLQGRGELYPGDRLVALLPISATQAYTLYLSSAAPTPIGLDPYTVTHAGVQTLTVSPDNPLVLFNLGFSLEWDARSDTRFMEQLEYDLDRSSQLLYDWTNGQVALGEVTVYHDRDHWNDADVRIYASNRLRPNAIKGGIVDNVFSDTLIPTLTYHPGQVNMAPTWNRYGDPGGSLGEDWPRTLAHELGHYALFLDDNYLGIDPSSGLLVPVYGCSGAMADPYREDYAYGEFHADDLDWLESCTTTISHQTTGRPDWASIEAFYPSLSGAITNTGPAGLPLAVTQIDVVEPTSPSLALEDPTFYLVQGGAQVQPGPQARAFLFQGTGGPVGRLTDLGRPHLDQLLARGARPGDRLCLFDSSAGRLGCEAISLYDRELELWSASDWQPDLIITPISSRTLALSVTNLPQGLSLYAQLYSLSGPAEAPLPLVELAPVYAATLSSTQDLRAALIHLWVDEPAPRREIVTDYALGGSPGAGQFGWPARTSQSVADHVAVSADGQVILFGALSFGADDFVALQTATDIPAFPSWLTRAGQAYRLLATPDAPDLQGASISFLYLGSEVSADQESWLRLYFWSGGEWQRLPTILHTDHNIASAPCQGPGLYALFSSIEIPLVQGWNLLAYPVLQTRSVTETLRSIEGSYSIVYNYNHADPADPWKVYGPDAPTWVNDLDAFEFGWGYWISATEAITLYLEGGFHTIQRPENLPNPPATFYGPVLSSPYFTPSAGMTLSAWVEGAACGQVQTMDLSGQVVYVISVPADDGTTGCGVPGRTVSFQVGTQDMVPTRRWNNGRLSPVELRPAATWRVYLPLVVRGVE